MEIDAKAAVQRYADKLKEANHQIVMLELVLEDERRKVAEHEQTITDGLAKQLDTDDSARS